jgi:hypothetical protein
MQLGGDAAAVLVVDRLQRLARTFATAHSCCANFLCRRTSIIGVGRKSVVLNCRIRTPAFFAVSEIARKIDKVVRDRLAPVLTTQGYRKTGVRSGGETRSIRVVNVQSSRSNAGEEGSFTLNLGVYFSRSSAVSRWDADDGPSE